nr:MAG TPA: hypothetical protein [Caudoviricetes sp.]
MPPQPARASTGSVPCAANSPRISTTQTRWPVTSPRSHADSRTSIRTSRSWNS